MKAGDKVTCVWPRGYSFTLGKTYAVIDYQPPLPEPGIGFTWPAYIKVEDDDGKPVCAHASRFKEAVCTTQQ